MTLEHLGRDCRGHLEKSEKNLVGKIRGNHNRFLIFFVGRSGVIKMVVEDASFSSCKCND